MASYYTTTQLQLTRNYLDGDIKGQFASKAIIHPEYQPDVSDFESPHGTYLEGLRTPHGTSLENLRAHPGGDGFMRLGDIRGEFLPSRKADGVSDQVAQLKTGIQTGDGFDTVRYETGLGEDNFKTGYSEAISCEDGDVRLGQFGDEVDALTNYRPYEMQADMGISANARGKTTGTIAAYNVMGSGVPVENHCTGYCFEGGDSNQASVADTLTNYRPEGIGLDHPFFEDGALERRIEGGSSAHALMQPGISSDNRFVVEPTDWLQGLDAGGMNYAEVVGLDSSTVDVVNKLISSLQPANEFI